LSASAGELGREALAAKLVGRWPGGAPLAMAPDAHASNDFDYDDDPHGFVTPRFAHVRKMYPRSSAFPERDWHRIIRRGVPFGPPYDAGGEGAERGLLFNAYMASIEDQFEFLQQGWANAPDFFEPGDGPDPLIGVDPGPVTLRRSDGPPLRLTLERFVRTSGALYVFVPSMPALRLLAADEP
jgi:hypothetical protein